MFQTSAAGGARPLLPCRRRWGLQRAEGILQLTIWPPRASILCEDRRAAAQALLLPGAELKTVAVGFVLTRKQSVGIK